LREERRGEERARRRIEGRAEEKMQMQM